VDNAFCNEKFDGFYDDPNDCQAFYQCLKGKPTKRFCLKGMAFNAMLKTCDTPHNFPCRLTEGADAAMVETDKPAANPDHRQGDRIDGGQNLKNSPSGTRHFFLVEGVLLNLRRGGEGRKKREGSFVDYVFVRIIKVVLIWRRIVAGNIQMWTS